VSSLLHDLRFALRALRRSPGLTAAAVAALGLGVGATAAVYSVVDAVLLEPLPYPEPGELVVLIDSNPEAGFPRFSTAPPDFADWRRQARSFETLAAFTRANLTLDAPGSEPERVAGAAVTHGFFEALGVEPAHGRAFRPEEDRLGGESVAVLGEGLWRRRFGADPGIVGRGITIGGEPRRVVGVMPAGFEFPTEVELWLPLALVIGDEQRGSHWLAVLGRLREGTGLEAAQTEMTAIAAGLAEAYPATNEGWTVRLHRLHDLLVEDVRPALRVLTAAVVAILLIVCANVANLLLVRTARRERELAVRGALGAGRGRLLRQLVTETVVLSLAGGLLGLVLGVPGTRALVALNAEGIPRVDGIGLDLSVFLIALGAAMAAGLAAGLVPGLQAARRDLVGALKEGTAGAGEGRRARLLRQGLVVAEVAVAVVLLVVAGLLVRSLLAIQGTSPGFEPRGALTAEVSLPEATYPDDAGRARFYRSLVERLEALPGVEVAGAGFPLPLAGSGYYLDFAIEGRPAPPPQEAPNAAIRFVTPGYVEALEVPLLAGRTITGADREESRPVALVNRAMARQLWPDESPLGARLRIGASDPAGGDGDWLEVVGVVGEVRHFDLTVEPGFEIYVPMAQRPFETAGLVLRMEGDPRALAPRVRDAVRAVDPSLPVYRVRTLEEVVAASLAERRFGAALLGVFAALALVLACLGVYGVLSYGVAQRTRELGLRLALGAPRRGVLRLVLWQGLRLVLIGVAVGLAGAAAASRLLRGLLYEVGAADPLTYAAVPAVLAVVALAAVWLPALRATRVEPVVALRTE
jgi:putative ABC transport system permease protein